MFKIFSFMVIFINFSVFAHIPKEEINYLKKTVQDLRVETTRIQDRVKFFCEGYDNQGTYIESPKYKWEAKLNEECEQIRIPTLVLVNLRKQRDSLKQEIKELRDNSKEYQNYQMLLSEWEKLGLGKETYKDLNKLGLREPVNSSQRLLSEQIHEALRNWNNSPANDSLENKRSALSDTVSNLQEECRKHTNDSKIAEALKMIDFHNDSCMQVRDNYANLLSRLRTARDQYEIALVHSKIGEEHKQERNEAVGSSTRAKGLR